MPDPRTGTASKPRQQAADTTKLDKALARAARLVRRKKWSELEEVCLRALETHAEAPHLRFFQAVAAFGQFRLGEAARLAESAFASLSEAQDIVTFLAVVYSMGGDLNTSAYYAKLWHSTQPDPRLAGALPEGFPSFDAAFLNIQERPLARLATREMSEGRWHQAEVLFREHLQFIPDDIPAAIALATCMMAQAEWQPAIDALRGFRQQTPTNAIIAATLASGLERWGRPLEAEACFEAAIQLAPTDPTLTSAWLNALHAHPRDLAGATAEWGRRFAMEAIPVSDRVVDVRDKLTVMWILPGMVSSAEREALAQALTAFDPTRARMIGVGPLPLNNGYNAPYQAAFDSWVDIHEMDRLTLRTVLAAQGADVIVDMAGMSNPDVVLALGQKLAPVQLATPALPHRPHDGYTGRVSDRLFVDTYTDDGLPLHVLEHGTVFTLRPEEGRSTEREDSRVCFGVDGDFIHFQPRQVRVWAEILDKVPDSVLLLRDHGFQVTSNAHRLMEVFGDFGICDRIDVFSDDDPRLFAQQIDVLLQPASQIALDTSLQALAATVPVIAAANVTPSARGLPSLLYHMGLADDLVAADDADYVAKACAWAMAPKSAFTEKVAAALASPVFDSNARGADLQALIERAWADAFTRTLLPS